MLDDDTDIDECHLGTHNCGLSRECRNIPGSFRCVQRECPQGFKLNHATGQCEAVVCPRGYRADRDGNCVGEHGIP
jgi:fibulin 1/2